MGNQIDWIQFAILLVTFVGLFIWNRSESRADIRHMDAKLESNRNLSLTIHQETREIIDSIREEIRDFHNKLYALEERSRKQ
jgi:hypothetical protein